MFKFLTIAFMEDYISVVLLNYGSHLVVGIIYQERTSLLTIYTRLKQ